MPPPAPPRSTVAGTWSVGSGTEARYGIDDTLLGQTTRVVGRTNSVSGTAAIDGLTVTSARVVVNMQSVHCSCMHDPMYHNMLETPKYPSSVFTLTSPIVLPNEPAAGAVITVPVTGTFSIHGNTRQVSFQLQATRIGATRFAVKGSIPVDLSDYDIRQPESGPVARVHNPSMELLIAFDKSN
ncbi:MAG: YceI family protein [Mycobacteriaceae bacterium]|nr:YceI family protein [Mycobacteriaceae bacterium]